MLQYTCRHFKGAVPCKPHKQHLVECSTSCEYKELTNRNVLIIKLGAMGDVIRTTPLLTRFKKEFPDAKIFWLTDFPDVVPDAVDWVLEYSTKNITWLRSLKFEIGLNLDKEPEACSLLEQLNIDNRHGFGLKDGMPAPVNEDAEHKFQTGISDTASQANTEHYLSEIFKIAGWEYSCEEYILPEGKSNSQIDSLDNSGKKRIIGLNTGCGGRWVTRIWPDEYWIELAIILKQRNYEVLFLGGPQEHEKNQLLAKKTGGLYIGHFPFNQFITLVDKCSLMVTSVTMAMHVAVGLKKPLVLFNNIFNSNEFHFFTESKIIEPVEPCICYYRPECLKGTSCLKSIKPEQVASEIDKLLQE